MVLTEAVQEGLSSVSPSISELVFCYLQKNASVQSNQHAVEPEVFEKCLKSIFGFGAKVIEKRILEALYVKLEVQRKIVDDFKFAEEVKNAQKLSKSAELEVLEQ